MINKFNNANDAFEYLYLYINEHGINFDNTKAIFNCGFNIQNPMDNLIKTKWRKWSKSYADLEWEWYLSAEESAQRVAEKAKIWKTIMDENGNVNSNYGYQWQRNNQLDKVIDILRKNPNTRKASISLYDGKEIDKYTRDTICTYAINFTQLNNKLNMSVMMRSNDLWYGLCNDQYCFSKLMELVSKELNYEIGEYYHFVVNLHIYNEFLNKNK